MKYRFTDLHELFLLAIEDVRNNLTEKQAWLGLEFGEHDEKFWLSAGLVTKDEIDSYLFSELMTELERTIFRNSTLPHLQIVFHYRLDEIILDVIANSLYFTEMGCFIDSTLSRYGNLEKSIYLFPILSRFQIPLRHFCTSIEVETGDSIFCGEGEIRRASAFEKSHDRYHNNLNKGAEADFVYEYIKEGSGRHNQLGMKIMKGISFITDEDTKEITTVIEKVITIMRLVIPDSIGINSDGIWIGRPMWNQTKSDVIVPHNTISIQQYANEIQVHNDSIPKNNEVSWKKDNMHIITIRQ